MIRRFDFSSVLTNKKTVLCLGNFDGVHLGHATLLQKAVDLARQNGLVPAVFCFETDPSVYFEPDKPSVLTDFEEKKALFCRQGIASVFYGDFAKMKDMTPDDFIRLLVDEMHPAVIVCGRDFRFGRQAQGDVETLKQNGAFETCVVDDVLFEGKRISATRIRENLTQGDLSSVNAMLGHAFPIGGQVVSGKRLARRWQFPTANITLSGEKLLPPYGVYVTKTVVDGKVYPSVSNLGIRPSVDDGVKLNLETHIFDFDGDIYGKTVTVTLLSFLRAEKRFDSEDALKEQIAVDCQKATEYHTKNDIAK